MWTFCFSRWPTTCRDVLLAAALLSQLAVVTWGQFGGLESRLPAEANTLVIFDVQKLLDSPQAQAENWREKERHAFEAGISIIPPAATHVLMALHLDFEYMQPVWQVTMARVDQEPDLPQAAARWGGQVDRIADHNTVRLPDDSYVVQFGKNRLGLYRPGNRQSVARWITSTNANAGSRLSPYLQRALSYTEEVGTPIIMAMDLRNAVSTEMVKERLKTAGSLAGRQIDLDRLAAALSSMEGVTLGISVKDRTYGALKVEFAEDVSFLGELAQPLLLEVLGRRGAMIHEFATWKPAVSEHRIQISGPLEASGLKRIFSIFEAPAALQHAAYQPGEGTNAEQLPLLASQQYYRSIVDMLDDLKDRPKQTMGQIGVWIGRYARKIDSLPTLNVDPELLETGRSVTASLRDAESALRGVGGKSRVRKLNAPPQYNYAGRWGVAGAYGWGGYGYGYVAVEDVGAEVSERVRIDTEERVAGADAARTIVQDIATAMSDIRQKMTEKYQVQF